MKCEQCEQEYESKRKTSRFCNANCRVTFHRNTKEGCNAKSVSEVTELSNASTFKIKGMTAREMHAHLDDGTQDGTLKQPSHVVEAHGSSSQLETEPGQSKEVILEMTGEEQALPSEFVMADKIVAQHAPSLEHY